MSAASASPVAVSRPTSQGELDRLERKVIRNSCLFLVMALLFAASCGMDLMGFEGSNPPSEGRNWLMAGATWLKGGVFLMCFLLARRRPHALGFGLGLLFIVAWLAGSIWAFADRGIHAVGWFVTAFLVLSGVFAFLTARKYDRALELSGAAEDEGAGSSAP